MKRLSALLGLGLVGCLHAQEPMKVEQDSTPKHIYMDSVVANNISFLYHFVTRRAGMEFALCLNGEVRGDTVAISSARLPAIYRTGTDSLSYRPCDQDENYIGMIHSHPRVPPSIDTCVMSGVDENRWALDERAKMEIVLCEGYAHFYFKK